LEQRHQRELVARAAMISENHQGMGQIFRPADPQFRVAPNTGNATGGVFLAIRKGCF